MNEQSILLELKNEKLKNFNWLKNRLLVGEGYTHKGYKDIFISKTKGYGERYRTVITFRNSSHLHITDLSRITVCRVENKLYFKGDEEIGYKITKRGARSKNPNPTYCIFVPLFDGYERFLGEFSLKYDDFLELYFIEEEGK